MLFVDPAVSWLLFEWFLVGFTGAVVPGSVLLVTITETTQHGWVGGESVTLGHCILEIFLVGSIFLGLGALWINPLVHQLTPLIGGVVLILFGLLIPRGLNASTPALNRVELQFPLSEKPNIWTTIPRGLSLGVTTSAANPYFLIWWITIGGAYISQLIPILPLTGFELLVTATIVYVTHIAADIIWYSFVILVVTKGIHLLNERTYRILILVSAVIMIILGARFLWQGVGLIFSP